MNRSVKLFGPTFKGSPISSEASGASFCRVGNSRDRSSRRPLRSLPNPGRDLRPGRTNQIRCRYFVKPNLAAQRRALQYVVREDRCTRPTRTAASSHAVGKDERVVQPDAYGNKRYDKPQYKGRGRQGLRRQTVLRAATDQSGSCRRPRRPLSSVSLHA